MLNRAKTHNEYVAELSKVNPNLLVVGTYTNARTKILHTCLICGHLWSPRPQSLLEGCGCPVCSRFIIGEKPEYRNSIWASEYRDLCSQFMTEEQMKAVMPHSRKKILVKCPYCGSTKEIYPDYLIENGSIACKCGDGVFFANKFVSNLFYQLKINTDYEYSPDWANGKRYDNYLIDYNSIVENHGMQHYKTSFSTKTVEDEQANDELKKKLAIDNNIKHYIVIDCRYSTLDYIKQNIMDSILPELLNFTEDDINWKAALEYASKSLVRTVADLYNMGCSMPEISKKLNISRSAIWKWLKIATELNLCSYNVKTTKAKQIYCIDLNLNFSSIRKASRFLDLNDSDRQKIPLCCEGLIDTVAGYHWQYIT